MPKVLVLARHFPPISGAGVQRTLGSIRYLPEHGYELVVVTGPAQHRDRWNPQDPELMARVPDRVDVQRLEGPEPTATGGLAARLERIRQVPPPWVRWWVAEAVRLGRRLGADADLVLASCIPYETAYAGGRLAAELGVPWVADLEDPWALDEMRIYPTGLHRARELRRMRAALASTSAIVMAAPEAAARVVRAMPELNGRVTSIPIGFEPDDFPKEDRHAESLTGTADDGGFQIVHTGSMHTDFGLHLRRTRRRRRVLGGAFPGVDILPRSHVFLVQAIEQLLASDPQLRGRVTLHLAGELTPGDRAVADRHAFVQVHGLLPHRETLRLIRSANLLFLPMHDMPPGKRAGLIPYKTYEYLAAGRPILAAVPDGDVRDLLAPLGQASLVRPADVAGMKRVLRDQIAWAPVTQVDDGIGRAALRPLERGRSVAQIATVLHEALKASPSRTGLAA